MDAADSRRSSNGAGISILAHGILFVGAAAAVFLCGGPEQGASGIFLLASGAALLICPPRAGVSWGLFVIGAVFLFLTALALLPQDWLPIPGWRAALARLPVPLAASVSTVPRETQFWLVLLAISVVLGLFGLAHPLRSRSLLVLSGCEVVVSAVYAGLAIYAEASGWSFPFDVDPSFGFFPNRNHSAAFLVSGSVLGLGILGVVWPGRHWLAAFVALAGVTTNVAALTFFSASRGGVVFLGAGTLLWFLGLGRERWNKPLVISFLGILAASSILFFVSKSEVQGRLLGGEMKEISLDGRMLIYQDTLRMIRDFPLTGLGLGAFPAVYPQYQDASLSESTGIHPESDWLMLIAEAGIPATVTAVAGIFLLLGRLRSCREHPYWPLRWGVICAVLAVFLHGAVDVPLHRVALGWWVLVLAGAGLQTFSEKPLAPPLGQRVIFWTAGLAALALGIFLVRAEWFGGMPSPPFAAEKVEAEMVMLSERGDLEKAGELASREIQNFPMVPHFYFQKAALRLRQGNQDAEVDALFAAQRALNPNWSEIPAVQGEMWLNIDAARTASLWQGAIERAQRIDRVQGRGSQSAVGLFGQFLSQSATLPELQQQLLKQNDESPQMVLLWLEQAGDKTLAAAEFLRRSNVPSFLSALSENERQRFLRAWFKNGDSSAFFAFIKKQPGWEKAARPLLIRGLADARQFQEAVAMAEGYYQVSLNLETDFAAQPQNLTGEGPNVVENFAFHWRKGNEITARRLLQEALASTDPKISGRSEIWRLSASLAARDGKWELAWSHLQRFLAQSGVDDLP